MKGVKTVLFGIAIMLLAIFSDEGSKQFIAENFKSLGSLTGLIVIVLRAVTTSPIFTSGNEIENE